MANIQGKERNPVIGATRAQETFHEKSLRRNIKDRRDAGRGCLFWTPPLWSLTFYDAAIGSSTILYLCSKSIARMRAIAF